MKTICFISARNLGDAVLHADFLKRLQRAGRADRWIIWTFSSARFLFEGMPNTRIVCSDFPIGATCKQFFRGGWRSFLTAVREIRHDRPDETLDVVGDFRERLTLRLLGASVNHSPEWETGHPFRNHNRMPPFRPGTSISVPANELSLYAAQARMLRALLLNMGQAPIAQAGKRRPFHDGCALRIGLHPSASAPFKLWPNNYWADLVHLMSERFPGSTFTLFGAPAERATLEALAKTLRAPHELFTKSLPEFKARLSDIDLLFGLDSFSVHMAHSQGVPSLVLLGANDPRIFTPPSAVAVTHPGRCPVQPCGGRPSCVGTNYQYSCMIDITPQDVLKAVPIATEILPINSAPRTP